MSESMHGVIDERLHIHDAQNYFLWYFHRLYLQEGDVQGVKNELESGAYDQFLSDILWDSTYSLSLELLNSG